MERITGKIDSAPVILETDNYTIKDFSKNSIWLEHSSGEGTQVNKEDFFYELNAWIAKMMYERWM